MLVYVWMGVLTLGLAGVWVRLCRMGRGEAPAETPREKRGEALERAWNEGVDGILGYDLEKAKGAVRHDGE